MQAVEFLHAHGLRLIALFIDLDAAETRQDVGHCAVDQAGSVKFGCDLHGETQFAPGRQQLIMIRQRAHQIAAELEHCGHFALEYGFAGFGAIQSFSLRRFEAIQLPEFVVWHQFRLLGDAHGALALHVGVTADRQYARPGLADIAAHQQQIDEKPHILDAANLLGQAHAVTDNRGLCARVDHCGGFNGVARQARTQLDFLPIEGPCGGLEVFKALGMPRDEILIEDAIAPGGPRRVIERKKRLCNAHKSGLVAADDNLMILRTDPCRGSGDHLQRILRIGEALETPFTQRVEDNDGYAPLGAFLKRVQHARCVHAGIVADDDNAVGFSKIIQLHGADRHADTEWQPNRCALVAKIGAIGKVVSAV